MTKVLLLGLGRWGVNHLRNLNSMAVELYVAETDAKLLEPAKLTRRVREGGKYHACLYSSVRHSLD